jgi:hypothetical protein
MPGIRAKEKARHQIAQGNGREIKIRRGKMKTGAELITDERQRQIEKEGWSAEHDEQHTKGELALAASLYATPIPLFAIRKRSSGIETYDPWPWHNTENYDRYNDGGVNIEVPAWDKRKKHSKLRRLVIAGALIAAEIDRLQR